MTTSVRFHAGTSTSGGTIISIVHGRHRLVFDFGFVFDLAAHTFDDQIKPGGQFYVGELLKLGLLPRIDGVFTAAALGDIADEVEPAEASALETMVLISHPHEDHVGGIGLIAPQIRVVLSDEGAELMRTLRDLGTFRLPREIEGAARDEPFSFGPFTITPRYSDHPAWGSVGFEIETPGGRIFWTGDWRLHGIERPQILAGLDRLRERGVDLLITEGSSAGKDFLPAYRPGFLGEAVDHVMPDGLLTEAGVDEQFRAAMLEPGLVVANFYERDFAPAQNLMRIARESGRRMAFQVDQALILERLTGELPSVYVPGATESLRALSAVERDALTRAEVITRADVLADPSAWVLQLPYRDTLELLAFDGIGGSYLHVGGTPFADPHLGRLKNVLAKVGLQYTMAGRHTHFAHATPAHLVEFVERMRPSAYVVVHALFPDAYVVDSVPRVRVEPGVELILDGGRVR